jgi:hypothetical protein
VAFFRPVLAGVCARQHEEPENACRNIHGRLYYGLLRLASAAPVFPGGCPSPLRGGDERNGFKECKTRVRRRTALNENSRCALKKAVFPARGAPGRFRGW